MMPKLLKILTSLLALVIHVHLLLRISSKNDVFCISDSDIDIANESLPVLQIYFLFSQNR